MNKKETEDRNKAKTEQNIKESRKYFLRENVDKVGWMIEGTSWSLTLLTLYEKRSLCRTKS